MKFLNQENSKFDYQLTGKIMSKLSKKLNEDLKREIY